MRSLLCIIFFLCLSLYSVGQTEQETLDWLNIKKLEAFGFHSYHVTLSETNTLKFSEENITLESADKKSWTKIKWSSINDFRVNDETAGKNELWIVSDLIFEGKPLFIIMSFAQADLRDRFSKAVEHLTHIKGSEKLNKNNYSHSIDSALVILKSRLIDVYEGDNKLRLELSRDKIKQYYLNSTSTKELYWKELKEVKSEVYKENNNYQLVKLIGKADNSGNIPFISFYIFSPVTITFVNAVNYIAIQNGAKFIRDDLF